MRDGSRWVHYALVAALAGVVVSPALAKAPKDGFPLSTYPMFATKKDTKTTLEQAVAAGTGEPIPLGPRYLGTDEVLQARATLSRAVRGGRQQELCAEVAARAARGPELGGATHVVIRTVSHDSLRYFVDGDQRPVVLRTHARCEIPR